MFSNNNYFKSKNFKDKTQIYFNQLSNDILTDKNIKLKINNLILNHNHSDFLFLKMVISQVINYEIFIKIFKFFKQSLNNDLQFLVKKAFGDESLRYFDIQINNFIDDSLIMENNGKISFPNLIKNGNKFETV